MNGFSATQAMDGFIRQFGEINPKTGKYWIPPYFLSLMNSEPLHLLYKHVPAEPQA